MNKIERFNRAYGYLKYEGVIKTQTDVADKMGASQSNVSGALKGKEGVLTDNFLMRFANVFKQISLDWLLYEKGNMLTVTPEFGTENTPQVLVGNTDKDVHEEQAKMTSRIKELMMERGHTPKTFALKVNIEVSLFLKKIEAKATWSAADIIKICDTLKVNNDWLTDGIGDKYRLPQEVLETIPARRSFNARVGKPYYNVDFALGFDLMVNDQTVNPEYYIDFQPYNDCDAYCNAHGNSMYPTISSGDIVALKAIKDFSYLINNEIYAIVTSNGLRTIKRVRDNGDTFTLIADNPAVSEQDIPKSIVTHVYLVKGLMKQF